MKAQLPEVYIREKRGVLITNSLDVAEKFGKRHDDVLKKVRNILADSDEFGVRNFAGGSYRDEQNQKRPMFEMTRSGFSILAMGFTGKKALEWKILYEDAFSKMEKIIISKSQPRWIEDRKEGKLSRREETDAVSSFIEYAKSQGSTKGHFYYKHFTNATYKALFVMADQFPGSFRDLLNTKQLRRLAVAEDLVTEIIIEGMGRDLFYKDIFRVAKKRLEDYAASVGVTTVISPALMLPMSGRSDSRASIN